MAKARKSRKAKKGFWGRLFGWLSDEVRQLLRWVWRGLLGLAVLVVLWVAAYSVITPPTTLYIQQEKSRLGSVKREWVPMDQIAPAMQRSVVAAEDANFCAHWGFDVKAIRAALAEGGRRGGSTLTQQVVKNAFLWHGRTWTRKSLEAMLTPVVELFWSKRRILEVYLNVAEFDEGVFGVGAAAQHYFGVGAAELSKAQAARLAAILPSPKSRSASKPAEFTRRRAAQILDGAETIRRDGRATCFED